VSFPLGPHFRENHAQIINDNPKFLIGKSINGRQVLAYSHLPFRFTDDDEWLYKRKTE
jgi:hypothetical protein